MLSSKINSILAELEAERDEEIRKEGSGMQIAAKERSLAIPRSEGKFLYILARSMKAKRIFEIGTSFGYSTLWLAAAVHEENGKVISVDVLPEKIQRASENIHKAGLKSSVKLIQGDAREILKKLKEPFDIIFLDADKRDYIDFIKLSLKKLRIGGVILSDNVIDCPEIHKDDPEICEEIMDFINSHPKVASITVPFLPNGLEMTLKIDD
ncbi:MAG: O-methyltransferase [Candidatus Hodarchaeales archaeon]|jgi:predicted O-methyltransferase YrrM